MILDILILEMDSSFTSSGTELNSSSDSGHENGFEIPTPPLAFSRNFSNVIGTLVWSYRYYHPNGDQEFLGDLFSSVHVIAHPLSRVVPSKWSSAQFIAFKTLSPEVSYEVHQSVRFALSMEQLSRSVYLSFDYHSHESHDVVDLLMQSELIQHVRAHCDLRQITSLFACYYLRDGHNCCEYFITMTNGGSN